VSLPQGQLISANNFRDRVWKPLLRRLGLRYRTVQAIRHTYATLLIMADANNRLRATPVGALHHETDGRHLYNWLELAKRQHTLQVDRLMDAPGEEEELDVERVTQGVTATRQPTVKRTNSLKEKEYRPEEDGVSDGFRTRNLREQFLDSKLLSSRILIAH
jgi:hypothetical protein